MPKGTAAAALALCLAFGPAGAAEHLTFREMPPAAQDAVKTFLAYRVGAKIRILVDMQGAKVESLGLVKAELNPLTPRRRPAPS